ncbi:hypothetical protein ACE4Z5_24220, partial [Salmonella enterica]|uniref:hypothetical protein n=1 Tax=Salmonella enterica TaxID=28901 RepID=UPI003D28D920
FGSAQSLAARVENPQLRGILDALVQDAQRGPIPYQAVAALRSKIGRQLNDRVAVSDIPRAELEAVYGALSQDMRATAERAGPEALAAFDRANRFYRAGMQRVEGVIDRVVKANAPERAYAFAMGA